GEPQVLQELPDGVRQTRSFGAPELRRELADRLVEVEVGAVAAQQLEEVIAEAAVCVHDIFLGRHLVNPESRARRASQAVRATPASRDSTSRAEWLQVPLLVRCSSQFRTILVSRSPSSAFLRAGSGRRTCPNSESFRKAPARGNRRQRSDRGLW